MHKFPIFNYLHFSELPFEELDKQRFSIYIIDFNWNYLFVNDFGCQNLKVCANDLLGKNMWKVYESLQNDPNFLLLKKNAENNITSNITTVSPVTGKRISITNYPLEDCYYFAVSILPDKESLMDELRGQLDKHKPKSG